jgi:NitT/TauT family transport system permease protein
VGDQCCRRRISRRRILEPTVGTPITTSQLALLTRLDHIRDAARLRLPARCWASRSPWHRHVRTLDRSLMPWIIASQTIPILAIGPMIIIVLGNIGITGVIPKAIISGYLSFFPVTIGMVKGLRSPDTLQLDLMHTYNARESQLFRKLRWPSSMPFLFASLKVSIAISLVGAIVGELPTGATAGLGARLLTGSYYGQTIQIWSALLMAALLGAGMVYGVGGVERFTVKRMGAR